MKGDYDLVLDLRSRTEFRSYYTGRYDCDRVALLTSLIPAGSIALDIGANIGFYSVPLASLASRTGGHVHAFEPVKSNFDRLQDNLALNLLHPYTSCHRVALGEQSGTVVMTLREDFECGSQTGNASIRIDDGADDMFEAESAAIMRLDDLPIAEGSTPISVIKIDVEGHEDLVFAGGIKTIEHHRPIILAEINTDYYDRRNVDVDLRFAELFYQRDYTYLVHTREAAWEISRTLKGRGSTDDVLLVPNESLESMMARLPS